MGVMRRPVPTLIHDGKAYVEAIHYDQARTDNDYAENAFRENESLRQQLQGAVEALRLIAHYDDPMACRVAARQALRDMGIDPTPTGGQ
jgi:hypothetical protein